MSVQSEIDRINSEVSDQGGLIEQIKTALNGKVIGGTVVDTADADATAGDILNGKTAYVNGRKLTGSHVCPVSEPTIDIATYSIDVTATSIIFHVPSKPKAFSICPQGNITLNTSSRYVVNVVYDGTTTRGIYAVSSGSSYNLTYTATHSSSYFTWTYADGVLTVATSSSTNGGVFATDVTYQLMYVL